uniref:DC1 domain-containing protein n=1 Tax=Quercus lobata TaxID=97700 RepID=A0A7N2L4J2_QUELO
MEQQQQQIQHFFHLEHPLVFNPDDRRGYYCYGCGEVVYGPSYSCKECLSEYTAIHHKSCAELPLGLHHPLHPIHPLILSPEQIDYGKNIQFSKCVLCNESRNQYTYRCSRCDFSLHFKCDSLPPTMEAEVHEHPLTPVWKWITFTCDLCGVEDKGLPFLCNSCCFLIHRKCASFPRTLKVIRHRHLLHLTHSSLEFHPSDSRFCQICVEKVDTHYGLYYCSRCDFAAHLDCAMGNKENINLQEFQDEDEVSEHDELVDSATYEVKKFNVGKDGIQIAAELKHFSHDHDLKLTDEVMSNQKCDGCVRDIFPPFYSCVKCSFFLHDSCANLPKEKRHPLHQHPLTLFPKPPYGNKDFRCWTCERDGNGFNYSCVPCRFTLDIPCSLISDILTHPGHEHRLILSSIESRQNCSCCDSNIYPLFRCTTCAFALDFKCATLPYTARYGQHEHAFTLSYTAEDDSGEYYCDICEEERVPKHWFYYCIDCSYPAHPKCILGKYPNYKFGVWNIQFRDDEHTGTKRHTTGISYQILSNYS